MAELNEKRDGDVEKKILTPDFPVLAEHKGKVHCIKPGEWVRELVDIEAFFGLAGNLSTCSTLQALYVATPQPLARDTVHTAFVHLVKIFPILNFCVQRRCTQYWYRRVQNPVIDVQVMDDDQMTALAKARRVPYDMENGPLWFVRLVNLSPDEPSPCGIKAENHTMIIFCCHHVVNDSTTNMTIWNELISILNKLIKGEPITTEPYSFSPPVAEFFEKPSTLETIKYGAGLLGRGLVRDLKQTHRFGGLIPKPHDYRFDTGFIWHIFSEEISKNLITRCKENKATINSCLVAAANVTLYDMKQKRSKNPTGEATIHYESAIDERRYYPKREKEYIGMHISELIFECEMTAEKKRNFWELARQENSSLLKSLEDKTFLLYNNISKLGSLLLALNTLKTKLKLNLSVNCQYSITNAGLLTKYLNDGNPESPIQSTDFLRLTNFETGPWFTTLGAHSFNKRLYISLDVFRNKISDEDAQEFFDIFKGHLTSIALNNPLE